MTKADNNTFIDEHFVQDSALVLLKGAFLSSVIEVLCLKAPVLRGRLPVEFCQGFAPEVVTFVHLTKSQWTTDMMKIRSNLNMFLFAGTPFYATGSPIPGIRNAVISMVYYQAVRSLSNTAVSYQTATKQQDQKRLIEVNGVSSGLMVGGLSLLFAYRNTLQYPRFILLASSAFTAFATALFYVAFGDSEKMNGLEKTRAVFSAVLDAGIVAALEAGVVAGAGTASGVEAITKAMTITIAGAVWGATSEAKGLVVTIAGAGAGIIIMMTGCISSTLLERSDATAIVRSLTVTTVAGLPLMVSSWLISLERFAEDNVAMHETMQNEFIFSLPVSKVLSLANWVNWLTVRDWFTD